MPKILFIHRGLRDYRLQLFNMLGERLNIDIMLTFTKNKETFPALFRKAKFKSIIVKEIAPFFGYNEGFSLDLVNRLLKSKYDLIISSELTSWATFASFLIAKLKGQKFIVWDELWEWPKTLGARLVKPYAKFIVRHSEGAIVAGQKAKEFYESFGMKAERIFISNDCAVDRRSEVDFKEVKKIRKKFKLNGKKVILYLGRIIKYKGLDYLIRAFKNIEEKDKDVLLLVVGPDCGWENYCKKLAAELKIKNIRFLNSVKPEQAANYYMLGDVFVLPARFLYENNVTNEAWGLAINEAMSLSKPVVSTNAVAAAYDIIKNGMNGYQVQERNVSELQNAILKTLANSKKMGKASRKIFEDWNDYEKMYLAFEMAIRKV